MRARINRLVQRARGELGARDLQVSEWLVKATLGPPILVRGLSPGAYMSHLTTLMMKVWNQVMNSTQVEQRALRILKLIPQIKVATAYALLSVASESSCRVSPT